MAGHKSHEASNRRSETWLRNEGRCPRRWSDGLLSAKGAAFKAEAWGNAPGFVSTDTSALKARFIQLSRRPKVNLAFSAGLCGHKIPGAMPQAQVEYSAFAAKLGAVPLVFRVPLQLLRQVRRNVRDHQSIIALISQFEDVTNPMDLRDQRAFVRGNPKPRTQSP